MGVSFEQTEPVVIPTGERRELKARGSARLSAATACWPADGTSCQKSQPRVHDDRRHRPRSAERRVQREAQRAPGTEAKAPRRQAWPPQANETGGKLVWKRRISSHSWLPEARETGTLSRARVWCPRRPRWQRARARRPSVHLSLSRPAASSSSVPLGRDRSPSLRETKICASRSLASSLPGQRTAVQQRPHQ